MQGSFKVICMLLGQQGGCTKFSYFLCKCDSRDKIQYCIRKRLSRSILEPETKNIVRQSLFFLPKVLLPLLNIEVRLNKQFVRARSKERECFKYI